MANIFEKTDQTIGGAFTAENCILSMTGANNAAIDGAIVQRVQFNIERPINFIYEIPNKAGQPQKVYYVGGRRRGQATFERVVGGSGTFKLFVDTYGPLCDTPGTDITLSASGQCAIGAAGGAAPVQTTKYTLKVPKITALGASVSAQDIVIVENVQMMFLDLEYA
jgi:hypothetical protein